MSYVTDVDVGNVPRFFFITPFVRRTEQRWNTYLYFMEYGSPPFLKISTVVLLVFYCTEKQEIETGRVGIKTRRMVIGKQNMRGVSYVIERLPYFKVSN